MSVLSDLHKSRVARLSCVCCIFLDGTITTQVEVHHIERPPRTEVSDFLVLPLCAEHHRGYTGVHGRSRQGFEKLHGVTQLQLLGLVISMLLADRASLVGG